MIQSEMKTGVLKIARFRKPELFRHNGRKKEKNPETILTELQNSRIPGNVPENVTSGNQDHVKVRRKKLRIGKQLISRH